MDIRKVLFPLVMGAPIAILLWISIKRANIQIKKLKRLKLKGEVPIIEYTKLAFIYFCITVLSFLILFLLASILAPSIIFSIPIVVRMLIVTMILVVFSCFAAFFMGLRNVVGAGGSAGKVIKTLSGYLQEAININDTKDHIQNKSEEEKGQQ